LRDGVVERLRERGDSLVGTVALSGRECQADGLAMNATIRAFLQRARPDAVILALPQRASWCAIVRLVDHHPTVTVITSDSFTPSSATPLSQAQRAHLHSLVFWRPGNDSVSLQFIARSRALRRRDPEPGEALAFDAYRLIVAGIRAGHGTRESMGQWLRQLGTPGHPAFEGITGPIDFRTPRSSLLHLKPLRDTSVTP
jgi:hypothetical protein